MRRGAFAIVCFGLLTTQAFAQHGSQPFNAEALLRIARVSDPQISPDGKAVAFTVTSIDLTQNTKPEQIYVVPVDGGPARQVTTQGNKNERPRWMPDSKRLLFVSDRSGVSQIWMMDVDGLNAHQITSVPTEAGGELLSPDGKYLVFASEVYPSCGADMACNAQQLDKEKASKTKARIYTSLLYRHWTQWQSARRSHLLSMEVNGGPLKDLTPGSNDVPPFSLGGPEDYAISPDSKEVAFTMNTDPVPATSTNTDIFTVPVGGGEAKRLTTNLAADSGPTYSPDGKYIAYRTQVRAGYESDRWRLALYDRAGSMIRTLTEDMDRPLVSYTWPPNSRAIFFTTNDRGREAIQMLPVEGGGARMLVGGASSFGDMQFSPDGKIMVYTGQSASHPVEIYRAASGGAAVQLTHLNDALLSAYALNPLEEFGVDASDGARVYSFLLKPPGFDSARKYPVLFLIHGGPQGAWGEDWSYRWNAQVFAGAGYVVVMPNPRGSVGYGQKFTDEVNYDWGGKPYTDIMSVVDHVAAQPYADPDRLAAAGASFGGYMIDWMLGHTTRFKAFVSHDGVFDLRSMVGSTEELWFPIWEFHGMPWDDPEAYAKWSPSFYVKNFQTPTLVVHGEQDFRVPYAQGLQLFTALQMQKAPSKLLLFPDEGHWVLKPVNSELWYNTVLDWIAQWTHPAAKPAAQASR